jgi:hypothetical protein
MGMGWDFCSAFMNFFLGSQHFRVFVLLLLLLLIKDLAMEQTIPLSLQVKVISAKHVIPFFFHVMLKDSGYRFSLFHVIFNIRFN